MKNIIIQEGGINKTLSNIKKIQTAKSGSNDDIYWIPEDEAKLGEKTISKNGTYKAEDDNLYGYSKVIVKGVGKASGVKPGSGTPPSQGGNGNDNEYSAEKDDDTGELVEKVLPSSIKVTTPPTKTTYQNGETIDTTGMVITAYKNDGTIWSEDPNYPNGIIPLSEITIEPTVATSSGGGTDEYSDGEGVVCGKYTYANLGPAKDIYLVERTLYGVVVGTKDENSLAIGGLNPEYEGDTVYVTVYSENNNLRVYLGLPTDISVTDGSPYKNLNGFWRLDGSGGEKSGPAFSSVANNLDSASVPMSTSNPYGKDPNTFEPDPHSDSSVINAMWNRVEDEQELTDTFNIRVNQ